jgi:hypothetical protein
VMYDLFHIQTFQWWAGIKSCKKIHVKLKKLSRKNHIFWQFYSCFWIRVWRETLLLFRCSNIQMEYFTSVLCLSTKKVHKRKRNNFNVIIYWIPYETYGFAVLYLVR